MNPAPAAAPSTGTGTTSASAAGTAVAGSTSAGAGTAAGSGDARELSTGEPGGSSRGRSGGASAAGAGSSSNTGVSNMSSSVPQGQAEGSKWAVERVLEELQEYHRGACRERAEFKQERSELSSRLTRYEHELRAEELIGRDMARRIETLEEAIRRERLQYEELLKGTSDEMTLDGFGRSLPGSFTGGSTPVPGVPSSWTAATKRVSPAQEAKLLAAYLERLPKVRMQSCKEALLERMREEGISFASPMGGEAGSPAGAHEASSSQGGATSSVQAPEVGPVGGGATKPPWEERGPDSEGMPLPTWKRRWTFQSHLDGARCVCCDERSGLLISCGEDALVKGWDLTPLWRGAPHPAELEPYVTLRGHTAPVLALAYRPQDHALFSAGLHNPCLAPAGEPQLQRLQRQCHGTTASHAGGPARGTQ